MSPRVEESVPLADIMTGRHYDILSAVLMRQGSMTSHTTMRVKNPCQKRQLKQKRSREGRNEFRIFCPPREFLKRRTNGHCAAVAAHVNYNRRKLQLRERSLRNGRGFDICVVRSEGWSGKDRPEDLQNF